MSDKDGTHLVEWYCLHTWKVCARYEAVWSKISWGFISLVDQRRNDSYDF